MINIVLDTNIIYDNWYLRGPNFSFLEELVNMKEVNIILPEIVVAETKNKYRQEIEKLTDDLSKNSDKMYRLIPDYKTAIPKIDTYELCQKYNREFDERLVSLKVQRIGHEDISHDSLINKALNAKKPFKEGDRGYRDALLWEVILNKIANLKRKTFFITKNYKDFGDKSGETVHLEQQLVLELLEKGLPEKCVILFDSLSALIWGKIIPKMVNKRKNVVLGVTESIIGTLGIDKWIEENKDVLIKSANNWIDSSISQIWELPSLDEQKVVDISKPEKIKLDEMAVVKEERAYIYASAVVDVYVEGFVQKPEIYGWENKRGFELNVLDMEWNKYVAWVELVIRLPVVFSIMWNVRESQIQEFEMEGREFWGWCPNCGEPVLSDAAEYCYYCGKSLF